MKRTAFFIVFIFSIAALYADILTKLPGITASNSIPFYDHSFFDDYMFSIYADGDNLTVGIFTDTSSSVSIMAYKINSDNVKIIVKYRTWDRARAYKSGNSMTININYYYLIELEETDGKIESYCNRIDEINLNGFIINNAVVFETINARLGPDTTWNESIELKEGDRIKVLTVEKDGTDAYNKYDHWYKIIVNEEVHWVFGFFIDFDAHAKVLGTVSTAAGSGIINPPDTQEAPGAPAM
jgi:hypothetical protein